LNYILQFLLTCPRTAAEHNANNDWSTRRHGGTGARRSVEPLGASILIN
jgi:hypothetical protein